MLNTGGGCCFWSQDSIVKLTLYLLEPEFFLMDNFSAADFRAKWMEFVGRELICCTFSLAQLVGWFRFCSAAKVCGQSCALKSSWLHREF